MSCRNCDFLVVEYENKGVYLCGKFQIVQYIKDIKDKEEFDKAIKELFAKCPDKRKSCPSCVE